MNQIATVILAAVAVIILTMALSTTRTGAALAWGLIGIAILAVVLRNESSVVAATQRIAGVLTKPADQQTNP